MKTLIFSNSIWNIYNFRLELIKEISKKNDVIIYCNLKKNFNIKRYDFPKKIQIKNIFFSSKSTNFFENFKLIYKILKIIKKERPDNIFSFTLKPNIFCGLISYIYKFSFFPTLSGLGTAYNKGGFFFIIIKHLMKISFKNTKKIFTHNTYEKFLLTKLGFNKKKIIQVNGSGIDFNKFKKLNFKKKLPNNNFLYLGRLISDKGINELIDAFKMLEKKINCKLTLAVIIDNDNASAIDLKILRAQTLTKNISIKINVKNVKKLIKTHDCMVLPSYSEGMSRAIMEAASLGRPIICSNIYGCKEMVKSGFNGFLVEPRSVKSLYLAILKFSNLNFKDKTKFGSNSRLILKKKGFHQKDVIIKYIKELNHEY